MKRYFAINFKEKLQKKEGGNVKNRKTKRKKSIK